MELIIKILIYLGLTALFVESEPIILIKRFIGLKEERIGEINKIYDFFCKLVYCNWCSSFWISLILSKDIKIAIITSFFMWLIEKNKF